MVLPKPPAILGQQINGHSWDFSSIETTIDSLIFNRIQSIDYNDSLEPGVLRGQSALMLGRTRGVYDTDASIEIYKADVYTLFAALAAKGQGGFGEATFDVHVVFSEQGSGPITDSLLGCRIKDAGNSFSQGGDALTTTLSLSVMQVKYNGLSLVSDSGTGAAAGAVIGAAAASAIGGL